MTDAYRRSYVIKDGWDLDDPVKGISPFLDSTETFGPNPYGVDMPGPFSDEFAHISPWIDYANDREKRYQATTGSIQEVIVVDGTFDNNSIQTFDKMSPHGFIFVNNPIGIDSIAYGGLKK